jgi:hypothetical protein
MMSRPGGPERTRMHAQNSWYWTSVSRGPKIDRPVTLSNEPAAVSTGRSEVRIIAPLPDLEILPAVRMSFMGGRCTRIHTEQNRTI